MKSTQMFSYMERSKCGCAIFPFLWRKNGLQAFSLVTFVKTRDRAGRLILIKCGIKDGNWHQSWNLIEPLHGVWVKWRSWNAVSGFFRRAVPTQAMATSPSPLKKFPASRRREGKVLVAYPPAVHHLPQVKTQVLCPTNPVRLWNKMSKRWELIELF